MLTAAHCVCYPDSVDLKFGPNNLILILGTNQRKNGLTEFNLYGVSAVFVQPDYNQSKFLFGILTNDIAVIKLSKKIVFSNTTYPICLPTSKDPSVIYKKQVVMTGW